MNILVLSPIYPGPDVSDNFTKVVHYFTKEWVKVGENVQVINIPSFFPRIMYHTPKWIRNIVNRYFGSQLPEKRNHSLLEYKIDNVPVLRVPLFKLFPGKRISDKVLIKAENDIEKYLISIDFNPDIVVAHWTEPSLFFIDALKMKFGCPTVVVTHVNQIKHYKEYIDSVNLWGYRRISCLEDFKSMYPSIKFSFRCLSGIPEIFLNNAPNRNYSSVFNYIYVGMMLPRKHPETVIDAVTRVHKDHIVSNLSMLGDGSMLEHLRRDVKKRDLSSFVSLPGKVSHQEIIAKLDMADVFVMVSEDEVFGLVYIEAMARGCIVVASKGEGMEGIIEHKKNGFLVEAGNSDELYRTLIYIKDLSPIQRQKIGENAKNLAKTLSAKIVADNYLKVLYSQVCEEES